MIQGHSLRDCPQSDLERIMITLMIKARRWSSKIPANRGYTKHQKMWVVTAPKGISKWILKTKDPGPSVVPSQDAIPTALPQADSQPQNMQPIMKEKFQEPKDIPISETPNAISDQLGLVIPDNNCLSTDITDDQVEAIVKEDDDGTLSTNDTPNNSLDDRPSRLEALQHFSSTLARKKINVETNQYIISSQTWKRMLKEKDLVEGSICALPEEGKVSLWFDYWSRQALVQCNEPPIADLSLNQAWERAQWNWIVILNCYPTMNLD
ncbi:hypothetical protein ACH5RR_012776 [Cinchona calisaya]|uniref:Uncharacterized protein n=1 Tax=Cinchona calisaya TaxID=153742 RepID=A0ABD3ACD0_9GENT